MKRGGSTHLLHEAVLEQLVALVQHQHLHAREVDRLRGDGGNQTQRRRHQTVHLHTLVNHARQSGLGITTPTTPHFREHETLQTGALAEAREVAGDLMGQLGGGGQDDGPNSLRFQAERKSTSGWWVPRRWMSGRR